MNCCAHHNLPAGCNQGRDCPSRDEAQDEPVYSVDSVEYGILAVIVVCLVVHRAMTEPSMRRMYGVGPHSRKTAIAKATGADA